MSASGMMELQSVGEAVEALRGGREVVERGNAKYGKMRHEPKVREGGIEVLTFGPQRRWSESKQNYEVIEQCEAVRRLADWAWEIRGSFEHPEISLYVEVDG